MGNEITSITNARVSCESDNERGTTQRKRENAVPHVSKYLPFAISRARFASYRNYKLEWYGCLGSAWSYIEKPYKTDLQKDVQYFACKWYRKKSVKNNVIQDARENRARFNKKKWEDLSKRINDEREIPTVSSSLLSSSSFLPLLH